MTERRDTPQIEDLLAQGKSLYICKMILQCFATLLAYIKLAYNLTKANDLLKQSCNLL